MRIVVPNSVALFAPLVAFAALAMWGTKNLDQLPIALKPAPAVSEIDQDLLFKRKVWRYCVSVTYFNAAEIKSHGPRDLETAFDLCRREEDAVLQRLGELPELGYTPDRFPELRRQMRDGMRAAVLGRD